MAKTPFTKLKLTKKEDIKTIKINDIDIEIKQYLGVDDKLKLITNVINNSMDDNNFSNPIKVDVYTCLEIVYAYTNLSFTDKQKEDVTKLYDLLETNDVFNQVIAAIPKLEYTNLIEAIKETIDSIYKYKNSALGIMENISADYSNLDLDASAIQEKLADPNNLTLLKDVLTKLD